MRSRAFLSFTKGSKKELRARSGRDAGEKKKKGKSGSKLGRGMFGTALQFVLKEGAQ